MTVKNIHRRIICAVCSVVIAVLSMTGCSEVKNYTTSNNHERKEKSSQVNTKDDNKKSENNKKQEAKTTTKPTVKDDANSFSTPGAVKKAPKADPTYFDDVVFVGDSVSKKLEFYERTANVLGNAQFLTVGSMSATNTLRPVGGQYAIHPKYNGQEMMIEDAVKACGAKKMYIMFGMNDIGYGLDYSIANYKQVIDNVVAKNPDVKIMVQSVTPRLSANPTVSPNVTNEKIKEYNKMISDMCSQNGWYFIDVASVMYDPATGCLYDSYCSDKDSMGMHFTDAGCEAWVEYLLNHTV